MGELRFVKGCCPLDCQDTCSWVAHVDAGQVITVRGAKEHPFTRGVLCAKVNDYQARTYAPDRLLHPLRRVGPKGSGQFERISWGEALDTIAERFSGIIAQHGAEALLPHRYLGSMGIVQRRALMRLFNALGASRIYGSICGAAGNVLADEGMPRGFDPEDLVHSRLILLWGANVLTTSHHHWYFMEEARRRNGARIICIDPRRTRTARQCDEHIALRPGSDPVLAAGMAHVMFREGLVDLAFAQAVTEDLDSYRDQVAPWTPDRASDICGITPEEVVHLARTFAEARPAVIRAGIAPQQTVHGEDFVRALGALSIIGGHWRHPGGGLFIETSPLLDEGRAECPELTAGNPRRLDLARLGETLTDENLDPPIKGLMIWCVNPAVSQPDAGRVWKGLAREDLFTVVLEHFLTDTARFADIVLPSTTQLEHFDIVGAWGHHYISVNNPAMEPLGEAKSHGEVMRLLAQHVGLKHPELRASDEDIAASALPPDVSLPELKAAGWVKTSPPAPAFTSKLHLASGVPARTVPAGALQLLTPKAHFFLNSSFVNMPRQRKAEGCPTLEMNPEDATERGLQDGQGVLVQKGSLSISATLHVTDAIRPGTLALPGKWWGSLSREAAVANLLTGSVWSPGGQPAYNDTFVDVVRAPVV